MATFLTSGVPIPSVSMMYIDALVEAVKEDDAVVALARRYHNGNQVTYMSERVREFLGIHPSHPFCLNICRTIVLAVKDELSVSGFNTSEKADEEGKKAQSSWAWDLWTKNHMDAVQAEVHESTLSDRETFIIVDWNYVDKRARFVHNYRYTDLDDLGGDGQGCVMLYENDDVNQPARAAIKQWIMTVNDPISGSPTVYTRRNIYYPERIEKWIYKSNWEHYTEPVPEGGKAEPWPIPWIRPDGTPRGIPVIHFRNVGMMPEAWDAIPLQDAVNKTLVDIMASNDLTAFQMLVALGWYPTADGEAPKADGSNLLRVGPGQFIGSRDPNAKIEVIKGSDPTAIVGVLQDLIVAAAQITSTPTARFTTTKLIAGAETLKMQDVQLKKKAKDRRVLFGDAWESCLDMARKLANDFAAAGMDEEIVFSTIWADNETLDDLQAKKTLGVPLETIWSEAGYSQEQITNMKKTDEYRLAIFAKIWPLISALPEAQVLLPQLLQEFSGLLMPQGSGNKPAPTMTVKDMTAADMAAAADAKATQDAASNPKNGVKPEGK